MNPMLFWQIIFGNVFLKSPEDIKSHGLQPNCVALCQEKLPLKTCGIFLFSYFMCKKSWVHSEFYCFSVKIHICT